MPPTRSSPELLPIYPHLTDRDRNLLQRLDEHQVLTTGQIHRLLFHARRTCQLRLNELRALGLVDRFRFPRTGGGSHPWHWTLAQRGQQFQAATAGRPEPTARASAQRVHRLSASPRLPHLLLTNEFFVRLAVHARHHPVSRLDRWWSEQIATNQFLTVRPDGHGLWTDGGATVGFFLEADTGTEPLTRVVGKLDAYIRLTVSGGPRYPVLFWLGSPAREAHLHHLLRERSGRTSQPVAVATATHDDDPAGPVWLPVDGYRRVPLIALPSDHGRPHAGNPTFGDRALPYP
jgi:hypothetical protein